MKKRKKKTLSANRQLYMKERKRLTSMVSRLRKQGYEISLKDIAGDIPKRVTKKKIDDLKKIRSSKEIIKSKKLTKKQKPKVQEIPVKEDIPSMDDIIIDNFKQKMSDYHPLVREAVYDWLNYIVDNFGMEELSYALDSAEYESIELATYGGYVVNPEDLSLYLHRLSHFILGNENTPDLLEITQKVEDIIQQYEVELSEVELSEYGSWYNKTGRGKPKWAP